jgi:hypothetical protein
VFPGSARRLSCKRIGKHGARPLVPGRQEQVADGDRRGLVELGDVRGVGPAPAESTSRARAGRSVVGGPGLRRAIADKAFVSDNIYAGRYKIRISESDDVAREGEKTLRALRRLRDEIVSGARHRSDEYNAAKIGYDTRLQALIGAMKSDLADTR